MTTYARRSRDRKYVVCGGCRRSLCRRDRRDRSEIGLGLGHWLVWDDDWRLVDDHIERDRSAGRRLADGWKPTRHDWTNEARLALSRALAEYFPALCDGCRALNTIDPKRLDVKGVAPR